MLDRLKRFLEVFCLWQNVSPTTNPTADTITVHLIQRISRAFSMANLQLPETVGW